MGGLFQEMTISLKNIGLQSVPTLQSLSPKEANWAEDLSNASLSNFVELCELNSLKLQYTSLRDLITSSPTKGGSLATATTEMEWCNISNVNFKDNLLKLAARAYLQPTGKQETSETVFISRFWKSFSAKNRSLVGSIQVFFQQKAAACRHFFREYASRVMRTLNPLSLKFLQMRPKK